ncbi:MAG TPA: hypothetical protein VK469_00410 [Candidatus Kapabacteria bacterium]|nr:hypothetical protein [Candidatus Kapabacteria bacterium]
MTAMGMEFNYVKKIMKIKKTGRGKDFKIAQWISGDSRFILIKSGMGLEKARPAIRYLLDNFNINAIINIGIAGALKPGLNIGDLVLGEEILREGNTGEKNYKIYRSHGVMVEIIKKAMCTWEKAGNTKNKWYSGRIISVKKGVGSRERKNALHREFNADAVDMEAAAIIETCDNIPFVTVKSISDLADESLGISEDMMTDQGKINAGKLLHMFIFHPFSMIGSLKRMMKNTKLALSSLEFLKRELPAMAEAWGINHENVDNVE